MIEVCVVPMLCEVSQVLSAVDSLLFVENTDIFQTSVYSRQKRWLQGLKVTMRHRLVFRKQQRREVSQPRETRHHRAERREVNLEALRL